MKRPLHSRSWFQPVLLGLIGLAVIIPATQAATGGSTQVQPTITAIRLEGMEVVISARVPAGLKKITLQSSQRLGTGAWEPRAVLRLDGQGGDVTFRVPRSPDLEIVRVRADDAEALPSLFYRGTNVFPGTALSTITGDRGVPVVLAPGGATGGVVDNSTPPPSEGKDAQAAREVVESDIWNLQGDVLYFFNQYRGLQVIDIADPDAPVVRGTLSLPAVGEQMYVLSGQQVVLLARGDCGGTVESGSQVLIVDTAQALPRIVTALPLSGQVQESRLVGTALYVMTQTYRPVAVAKDGAWEWGTSIYAFDLSDPANPVARPSLWYPGYGNVLSATDQYLFISVADASNNSLVHSIGISAPDGTMQESASIRVAGTVKDKFKMSLSGTIFTVIAEQWSWQSSNGTGRSRPVTKLQTFSLADPAAPQKLGELTLADGEQLHATRFDGDRVYVVTFFQVDPLWVVDLSDPTRPAIKGEIKVPGWSTYIQPLGDRLVTIGIDNTNGWRVAVSLFDVHDPTAPALLSKVPLGENSSWSEATSDEKAFGILPEAGLLLVPYSSYSTNNVQGVQLIDFHADSLVKRGFIAHDLPARRSTLHRNRILSLSGRALLSVDASDRDKPVVRSETELAWPVNRLFLQGQYVVELETSSSADGSTTPTLRVAPVTGPEQILNALSLTNLPIVGATLREGRLYLLQAQTTYVLPLGGAADKGSTTMGTNQTALVCSVIDLSKLPELGVVNSTDLTTGEAVSGTADAVWPKPDLLVWALRPYNYWRGWYPVIDLVGGVGGGVSILPVGGVPGLWYPYSSGESRLLAVDVNDTAAPQFVSDVSVGGTNGWSNFSRPYAADSSVFLSQQLTETSITGTNYLAMTNTIYVLMTNVVVVTNYTKIPHESLETNYTVVTNVTVAAIKNILGDQRLLIPTANPASPATVQVLGGGALNSIALTADGHAWTWGNNSYGQLGDGTTSDRADPEPIPGLDGIKAIASGDFHNLALKSDGTVWAWGDDAFGELGDGVSPVDPNLPPMPEMGTNTPVQAIGLGSVTGIGAGYFHSLAVQADGSVWAWGANWAGQLGDGSSENQTRPVRVSQLASVIQVAGGRSHSLALQRDGTVWAWGANDSGQLGDGTGLSRGLPAPVTGLAGVTAIACGHSHNLALKQDGTVWAWGRNQSGQLGDGTTEDRSRPTWVADLKGVVALVCGQSHSLALTRDGSIWAWGHGKSGQLTGVPQADALKPVLVAPFTPAAVLGAGEDHSLAATPAGDFVWAWGDNQYGQLGKGDPLLVTNIYTQTNYLTVTTWTVNTAVVVRTNLVKVPQNTITTNAQPIYTSRQLSYLHVIDYTAPPNPVLRKPLTIPGALSGLSHQGALLYLTGYPLNADTPTDGSEWLHACAYDGVSCYLVDSHPLPKDWPHATLVHEPYVFLTRPDTATAGRALEIWTLADTGKFTKLDERKLAANASLLQAVGDLLAVQENTGLELFDLSDPTELPLVGSGAPLGCLGWNLEQSAGSLADGLWLPLDLYGTYHIELKK